MRTLKEWPINGYELEIWQVREAPKPTNPSLAAGHPASNPSLSAIKEIKPSEGRFFYANREGKNNSGCLMGIKTIYYI